MRVQIYTNGGKNSKSSRLNSYNTKQLYFKGNCRQLFSVKVTQKGKWRDISTYELIYHISRHPEKHERTRWIKIM